MKPWEKIISRANHFSSVGFEAFDLLLNHLPINSSKICFVFHLFIYHSYKYHSKMLKATRLVAIAIGLIFLNLSGQCYGTLQVGFYKGKCRSVDVEAIVGGVVALRFIRDRTITAALLRMQFHDCFVNVRSFCFKLLRLIFYFYFYKNNPLNIIGWI